MYQHVEHPRFTARFSNILKRPIGLYLGSSQITGPVGNPIKLSTSSTSLGGRRRRGDRPLLQLGRALRPRTEAGGMGCAGLLGLPQPVEKGP